MTDQNTFESPAFTTHDFSAGLAARSLESARRVPRGFATRGSRVTYSKLTMRLPQRHATAETPARQAAPELSASAHEDISRLNAILRAEGYTAVLGKVGERGSPEIVAPIFDDEGQAAASLDIVAVEQSSDRPQPLLRALAESSAGAISERWFRLAHRRHYVIAAMRRNQPSATILLAIDRHRHLVGANREGRLMLPEHDRQMGHPLALSTLFRSEPAMLRRRGHGDVSMTLFESGGGEPWVALITPPDPGPMESFRDASVLLHARPRLDSLAHSSPVTTRRVKQGLSRTALQLVEEYIETHIDSALDNNQLAGLLRMSSSHFTRSFHKSVGLPPHRYVIENRVMRARELLTTTRLPLSEIALSTGFADQSHLSRRFQELVGIPPGAFREREPQCHTSASAKSQL